MDVGVWGKRHSHIARATEYAASRRHVFADRLGQRSTGRERHRVSAGAGRGRRRCEQKRRSPIGPAATRSPDFKGGEFTLNVRASGYSLLAQRVTLRTDTRMSFALQPARRVISGTVIDATSHGVLPNILVAVLNGPNAGQSTRTDGAGNFTLAGITSEPTSLQASATSYLTSNWAVPAGGDVRVNIIMTRTSSPPSPPVPTPPPTDPRPPSGGAVITFRAGAGDLTMYSEAGFTVSPVTASWFFSGYGVPGPSLQFSTLAGVTTDGEIRITAGGSRFQFKSVDVYSSTTPIPYMFTGMLGSTAVFAVSGRQGNTFGNFATVANGRPDASIDMLLIRLSNAAAPCCGNPMGLDNIVLTR